MADHEIDRAVERCRAGEREAFREIVKRTAVLLRAYVSFFLSEADIVDDVVQDVYVRIHEELGDYELGTDFLAWVKTKARYAALAERRRLQRERSAQRRYASELMARASARAVEVEEARPLESRLPALKDCLSKLSERVRELVRRRYFLGQELAAVAEACGMKRSAATVALHRARVSLARCMEKSGAGA